MVEFSILDAQNTFLHTWKVKKILFYVTERGSSSKWKRKPSHTDSSESEAEADEAVEDISDTGSETEETPLFATQNPGM